MSDMASCGHRIVINVGGQIISCQPFQTSIVLSVEKAFHGKLSLVIQAFFQFQIFLEFSPYRALHK